MTSEPSPIEPIPAQTEKPRAAPSVSTAAMRPWLWGGMLICTLLWFAIPMAFKIAFGLPVPLTLPEFGDSFGGVSALFSALTMAGVIYSLLLQRDDIKLTLAELKTSAEAQSDIATIERENLKAKQSLTEKQDAILVQQAEHRDAMAALFTAQAMALDRQIKLLEDQTAADAKARFNAKFERRLIRWQGVRACLGDAESQGQGYIESNVKVQGKVLSCPKWNEANPGNLPYDFLGGPYMRYLKSLVQMFNEPHFQSLPPDEQEDFSLELRIELCDAERLVLLHLFAKPSKDSQGESIAKADGLKRALARVDALGGVNKAAARCAPEAWKAYRLCVNPPSTGLPVPDAATP